MTLILRFKDYNEIKALNYLKTVAFVCGSGIDDLAFFFETALPYFNMRVDLRLLHHLKTKK